MEELDSLRSSDFDEMNVEADGMERLYALCDDLLLHGDPAEWMPSLFALMERLDGVDLGSPGPLVHTLEKTGLAYRSLLADSMRRKPTLLAVWMANRILNESPNSQPWTELLEGVESSPGASVETVEEARDFLAYQRSRQSGR